MNYKLIVLDHLLLFFYLEFKFSFVYETSCVIHNFLLVKTFIVKYMINELAAKTYRILYI